MNKQEKINALCNKFDASALGQAVYLETRRTTNINDLTMQELDILYNRFFPKKTPMDYVIELAQQNELKRLRSVILKEAQILGIYTPNSWANFNRFMKFKSYLKKPLNDYNIEEFPELIKQFKSMSAKLQKAKLIPHSREWHKEMGLSDFSQN